MHRFGLQIFAANNALSSDGIFNMVCPIVDFRDNADIILKDPYRRAELDAAAEVRNADKPIPRSLRSSLVSAYLQRTASG